MMIERTIQKITLFFCSILLFGAPLFASANVSLLFKEQKRYPAGAQNEWKRTFLTGKYIEHAEVVSDKYENHSISIRFNRRGKRLFKIITARNIGRPLAIFLNDQLISSPMVQAEITGGEAVITGYFTKEEAEKFAQDLNPSKLPP